jgi:hypothetical protein
VGVLRPGRCGGVERAVANRRIGTEPEEEFADFAVAAVRGRMKCGMPVALVDVVADVGQRLDAAGVCSPGRVDQRARVPPDGRGGELRVRAVVADDT